jgi:hypothetical protein
MSDVNHLLAEVPVAEQRQIQGGLGLRQSASDPAAMFALGTILFVNAYQAKHGGGGGECPDCYDDDDVPAG